MKPPPLTVGSLCTGYGGLEMGLGLVRPIDVRWHCEVDPAADAVLAMRWPQVPNLGDLRSIDWSTVEPVDVVCAGFPCQPVSQAGCKRLENDERWLWPDVCNAVRVLRPSHLIVENVAGLLLRGPDGRQPIGILHGDLAALRYDTVWQCVRASDAGAPHGRDRIFLVAADADRSGLEGLRELHAPAGEVQVAPYPRRLVAKQWGRFADAIARWTPLVARGHPPVLDGYGDHSPRFVEWMMGLPAGWVTASGISRTDQLRLLGNGVVPRQAALALSLITGGVS